MGKNLSDQELLEYLFLIRFRCHEKWQDKLAYVTWAKTAKALGVSIYRLRKVYNQHKLRQIENKKPSKLLTRKKIRQDR